MIEIIDRTISFVLPSTVITSREDGSWSSTQPYDYLQIHPPYSLEENRARFNQYAVHCCLFFDVGAETSHDSFYCSVVRA